MTVKLTIIPSGKARLSLQKLVRRLEAAVKKSLQSFPTNKTQRLEYASLMSLSDASTQEAMRTMSALSSRIHMGRRMQKRGLGSTPSKSHAPRRQTNRRERQRFISVGDSGRQESRKTSVHSCVSQASGSSQTLSSESTKIGEIRRTKQFPKRHVRAAYPTPLLRRENPSRKNRNWWNPFRSKI